ncbi:hypothetical protein NQ318_018597 [Aromia moschata]|uniref:Uncharacterized protein n=1 Tax=Aromia moschata TaxID=1265417 RepID=A0AAV8ZHR6_9CUCU|nr:hypothetical protein NQ318_018597 [Aromia moschata]
MFILDSFCSGVRSFGTILLTNNILFGFLALTLVALKRKKQQKKKRRWSKEWYKMRNRFTHEHFANFLRDSEPEDYRNFLRMDQESFDYLLELVRPDIEKKDTNMREAISAIQRFSITLRYLACGIDLEDLKFTCAFAPQTLDQNERPTGLSSELMVGKVSPDTVLSKLVATRSQRAGSSISSVIIATSRK